MKKMQKLSVAVLVIMSVVLNVSCKKESIDFYNEQQIIKSEQNNQRVEFYVDNEKIDEHDTILYNCFKYTHIFLGKDNEHDLNLNFTSKDLYVEFLKRKGYTNFEIENFTSLNNDQEKSISSNQRILAVNPSLMTIRAFTDLNRTKYLAVFTGNTTTCNQTWENQILGMQVEAASTACQTGQTAASIRLINKCDGTYTSSSDYINVSLARCQSGTKYVYAIAPKHFNNWYSQNKFVSSWIFY